MPQACPQARNSAGNANAAPGLLRHKIENEAIVRREGAHIDLLLEPKPQRRSVRVGARSRDQIGRTLTKLPDLKLDWMVEFQNENLAGIRGPDRDTDRPLKPEREPRGASLLADGDLAFDRRLRAGRYDRLPGTGIGVRRRKTLYGENRVRDVCMDCP